MTESPVSENQTDPDDDAMETTTDATTDAGPDAGPDAGADAVDESTEESRSSSRAQRLEQEGEIAADYLEELLEIADLDGDLDMDVEGERAVVSIVGARLDQLVGDRGEVLESLQELTRLAVHRRTGVRSRLMLDIGGYRERRRDSLTALGQETADRVKSSGEPIALEPMTPFERKAVHDAVTEIEGVRSESEGEEPNRYIVVSPDPATAAG